MKVLILLALPASGKSEVRKFLRFLNAKICLRDFGLGHVIELDDYPYVHMMRLIDQVLIRADRKPTFFEAPDRPFIDAGNWLALIEFLNEDFKCLGTNWRSQTDSKARELLGRLAPLLLVSSRDPTATLKRQLETDAAKVVSALEVECAKDTEGATVVMEFARGGPLNASMPLPFPLGYQHSLAALSPEILRKASILYVDVDPAQARQKNRNRMPPPDFQGDTGIFHFVPEVVMDNDYGCDDIH
ncbi:MAG: hypothetical protein HY980_03970 [Candidatus Magasanikbacteria bacterium]|nr:hypothetical protein [Candidatus Magasanikbacteria bacterium]